MQVDIRQIISLRSGTWRDIGYLIHLSDEWHRRSGDDLDDLGGRSRPVSIVILLSLTLFVCFSLG
jgi:hypothetical protein